MALSPGDPNSHSRPDLILTTNLEFDWTVDFSSQSVSGVVIISCRRLVTSTRELLLDTNNLSIERVRYNGVTELSYVQGEAGSCGAVLTITLPDECEDEFSVSVQYSTSPLSPALVWLTKHQTAGLQQPFMFSQGTTITCHLSNIFFQGQAILNRALFPCQDTPAVKTPFQATVRVDKRVSAVMSALSVADPLIRDDDVREYKFSQPIPIPSYLVAIAVGDLTSRELGPRSRVYAEHEYIDKAAHDFSDTEAQLNIAEQLCGPYLWTRLINLYQIDVNV